MESPIKVEHLKKVKDTLLEVGSIATAIGALVAGFILYMNNVWQPTVELISVDYNLGIAVLSVGKTNPTTVTIYPDEKFSLGWGWNVQFGIDYNYDLERIELVKNNITYTVLDVRQQSAVQTT